MNIFDIELRTYQMIERAFAELDIDQFNHDGWPYVQIARTGEEDGARL